jgi:hypothetical protein
LARFQFESGTVLFVLPFIFVHLKNHVCLSHGVHVAGAAWRAVTRIVAGIGELMQRIGDSRIGYSMAGRSRGRVALCAVCTVHVQTRSASFLVEPQNQGQPFVSGLASKPLGQFPIGLGLKTDGDGL